MGIYTHPKSVYVKKLWFMLDFKCSEILIVAADSCQVMFDEPEHLILSSLSCQTVYEHFWYTACSDWI